MKRFTSKKQCMFIIVIFNLVLLLFYSISIIFKNESRISPEKFPVSHAFINSVYYYPTSKSWVFFIQYGYIIVLFPYYSLGKNALAFTMALDQYSHSMKNHKFTVLGYNSTHSTESIATSQTEGIRICRYVTLMARTNTVDNLEKIKIESNGVSVEVRGPTLQQSLKKIFFLRFRSKSRDILHRSLSSYVSLHSLQRSSGKCF